eukprot:5626005-Prymnesium_polylepis.1
MASIVASRITAGAARLPNAVGSPSERLSIGLPGTSRFDARIESTMARMGLAVRRALVLMGTRHAPASAAAAAAP